MEFEMLQKDLNMLNDVKMKDSCDSMEYARGRTILYFQMRKENFQT